MKRATLLLFAVVLLLTSAATLFADAVKSDWFGDWKMSLDGRPGVLRITDTKADCATSPWCDMAISYVGADGVRQSGTITSISDRNQHMVFYLNFPGNRQKFDAYIFSWDKNKLAGTTYWGGRTFGFSANK
ncbi:MAG: hypothetical protein QOJ88_186 [Pyrinomonadaceae bacterium]|jgi:hypothetical protein|nr:hypothetical protein [Pyrinomonadaceae bacterium]